MLWYGAVATGQEHEGHGGWTAAILEHNALVAADECYVSPIAVRDGLLIALRTS